MIPRMVVNSLVLFSLFHLSAPRRLLFLSIDGFRWDYFHMHKDMLPNVHKLAKEGAIVHNGLMNNWVTSTFPSHRSMLTGLYEESHGIIGNSFYAPEYDEEFRKWTTDVKFWNWSEPIWKVADEQGVVSACISISGCDVKEHQPTHSVGFSRDFTLRQVIDKAVDMFQLPKRVSDGETEKPPAQAVFFYHWKVDRAGHKFGPIAPELREVLKEVDDDIGYLRSRIDTLADFFDTYVDLILTSDHGMLSVESTMVLDNDVNEKVAKVVVNRGNVVHIWPYTDRPDTELNSAIDVLRKRHPNTFKMVKKEDLPERLHFKNNIRCPPILLIAEPGYEFIDQKDLDENKPVKGNHGYYPERKDMHPIFIGRGKSFKANYNHTSPQIELVDVVSLVSHLLNVKPNPNNGTLRGFNQLLTPWAASNETFPKDLACSYCSQIFTIICCFIMLYLFQN